jgi:hypothetical protein
VEMRVKLLWESHRVVWRQSTDIMEKASVFIVVVGEKIASRG